MNQTTRITYDDILEMAHRITIAAKPLKIILFGSYARNGAKAIKDIDLLVIERDPVSQRGKSVRLRTLLKDFETPIDIVVFGQSFTERYWDIPGSVLYPAFREGIILYKE